MTPEGYKAQVAVTGLNEGTVVVIPDAPGPAHSRKFTYEGPDRDTITAAALNSIFFDLGHPSETIGVEFARHLWDQLDARTRGQSPK